MDVYAILSTLCIVQGNRGPILSDSPRYAGFHPDEEKVSESSWTLKALRLRTHVQEKYHYSISKLVQDCCSLQEMLGAGGRGDLRNSKGLSLMNGLGTMVLEP